MADNQEFSLWPTTDITINLILGIGLIPSERKGPIGDTVKTIEKDGRSMAGRPRAFDDDELLEILYESDDPAMTAREIAEEMDESRRTVHRRLKALRDEGEVKSKKVGGRSVIWWVDPGTEANG